MTYLIQRFFYRLFDFFHHWYVDGSRNFFHYFISSLERLDRNFAIRVTLKYFFQPLYKDYSIVGRILGVVFRSGRIIAAFLTYLVFSFLFLVVYLIWLLIPAFIILKVLQGITL